MELSWAQFAVCCLLRCCHQSQQQLLVRRDKNALNLSWQLKLKAKSFACFIQLKFAVALFSAAFLALFSCLWFSFSFCCSACAWIWICLSTQFAQLRIELRAFCEFAFSQTFQFWANKCKLENFALKLARHSHCKPRCDDKTQELSQLWTRGENTNRFLFAMLWVAFLKLNWQTLQSKAATKVRARLEAAFGRRNESRAHCSRNRMIDCGNYIKLIALFWQQVVAFVFRVADIAQLQLAVAQLGRKGINFAELFLQLNKEEKKRRFLCNFFSLLWLSRSELCELSNSIRICLLTNQRTFFSESNNSDCELSNFVQTIRARNAKTSSRVSRNCDCSKHLLVADLRCFASFVSAIKSWNSLQPKLNSKITQQNTKY